MAGFERKFFNSSKTISLEVINFKNISTIKTVILYVLNGFVCNKENQLNDLGIKYYAL